MYIHYYIRQITEEHSGYRAIMPIFFLASMSYRKRPLEIGRDRLRTNKELGASKEIYNVE